MAVLAIYDSTAYDPTDRLIVLDAVNAIIYQLDTGVYTSLEHFPHADLGLGDWNSLGTIDTDTVSFRVRDVDVSILGSYMTTAGIPYVIEETREGVNLNLVDSAGNLISTVATIPTEVVGNSTVTVRRSDNSTIEVVTVKATRATSSEVPNSTVTIYKSNGATPIRAVTVKADSTASDTVAKASVVLKDSADQSLRTVQVEAEETAEESIADSVNNVKKSDGTLIEAKSIKAEDTSDTLVADSNILLNGVDTAANNMATDDFNIVVVKNTDFSAVGVWNGTEGRVEVPAGGGTPSTDVRYADINYSGAAASYANYDIGWCVANGYWERSHPATTIVQSLDFTASGTYSHKTLVEDNIHGTKNRFTLNNGTVVPNNTYSPYNRIYQDHLYGIEYVYPNDSTYSWANALHDPTNDRGGGVGDGWMLICADVIFMAKVNINNKPMIYLPVRPNQSYHLADTVPNTTNYNLIAPNVTSYGKRITSGGKTTSRRRLLFRFMTYT
tara:strand:+ start:1643 stop:3139 length:1497 start_codon:yes stop_codon:yes gene_type:complete